MIEVTRKEDCFGCTACESICPVKAISMQQDDEGFFYPIVNKDICINCRKCDRICPKYNFRDFHKADEVLGLINSNPYEYNTSSSGGIFIELCRHIIGLGGVVVGSFYDEHFNVRHKIANNIQSCNDFKGSKYTQSNLLGLFGEIKLLLDKGKLVLFSGTPCQIAGLKSSLGKDYCNLYTCDLVCHGVPSPTIFRDYIDLLEKEDPIKKINMKSKIYGDSKTAIQVEYQSGKKIRNTLKTNIWNKIYFGHYALRPSCHECPFTNFNRPGDITIGDFWGIRYKFNNIPHDKAVSLVMINVKKGHDLFKSVEDRFIVYKSCLEDAVQPSLLKPSEANENRTQFWEDYHSRGFNFVIQKYCGYTQLNLIKEYIKEILKFV